MDLNLKINKRETLSDQLYGQLLKSIVDGELKEGDKLPSENEISQAFKVSRPVIRESLMRLQADGLIYTRQGSGSFVKSRPADGLIEFTAPSDIPSLLRCYEARLPLEGAAASLAARNATKEDISTIEAALVLMEDTMRKGEITDKPDYEFHMGIAHATGNEFYVSVLSSLHIAMRSGMRVGLNLTKAGSEERTNVIQVEHRAIFNAIATGDDIAADLAMSFHIHSARMRLIKHQEEDK